MTRINFDEVSVTAVKKWTDENGRRRQKTKKFWQTMNPWNKNAAGQVKTRTEIYSEIWAQQKAWLESDSKD